MNSKELIKKNQEVIDSSYLTLLKSYQPKLSEFFDPHITDLWTSVKKMWSHFVILLGHIFILTTGCIIMLCMPLWIIFVPFLMRKIARQDINAINTINERLVDRLNKKS